MDASLMQVRTNNHRHVVLLVERGNRNTVYLELEDELELRRMGNDAFDKEYDLFALKDGEHPYTAVDFARHYMGKPMRIYDHPEDTLAVLFAIMQQQGGEVILFLRSGDEFTLAGKYASAEDARLIAKHLEGRPVTITSAEDLEALGSEAVAAICRSLDPDSKLLSSDKRWKGKAFKSTSMEVYNMAVDKKPAAAATKAAPKKIEKAAKERVKRTDGPVAQCLSFLDKNVERIRSGKMTRKDCITALLESGIQPATASTQASFWSKDRKVPFAKAEKPAKPAKPEKAEKPAKPAKAVAAPAKPAVAKASAPAK